METVRDIDDSTLVLAASPYQMGMVKYQTFNALVSAVRRYRRLLCRNVREIKNYQRPADGAQLFSTMLIEVSNARPAKIFRKVSVGHRYRKSPGQPNVARTSILKEHRLRKIERHFLSVWYRRAADIQKNIKWLKKLAGLSILS